MDRRTHQVWHAGDGGKGCCLVLKLLGVHPLPWPPLAILTTKRTATVTAQAQLKEQKGEEKERMGGEKMSGSI